MKLMDEIQWLTESRLTKKEWIILLIKMLKKRIFK